MIYWIIFILLIIFISVERKKNLTIKTKCPIKNKDIIAQCNKLYVENKNKLYVIINKLISKQYCNKVLYDAEKYAKQYSWMTNRHGSYPTTDNEITSSWEIYEQTVKLIKNRIFPEIVKMYNVDINKLGVNEIFVVKYSLDGQKKLEYHKDGSEFSFIIALNDEYEGGGTYLKDNKKLIKLGVGDCLVFSGRNTHKGSEITSGTRYILTGFLNYGGREICEDYFNNSNC